MSAINQIFGENVPSTLFQYQTPKKSSAYLNTNASIAYSQFGGSNQFRSSELRQPHFTHQNFTKGSASLDFLSEKDFVAQNNSVLTLNPVDNYQQMLQLLKTIKLVSFFSKQHNQLKGYAQKRERAVKMLNQQVLQKQEDVKKQKKRYEKQKKQLLAMQSKKKTTLHKRNSIIQKQLERMTLKVLKAKTSRSKKEYKSIDSKQPKVSATSNHQRPFSQKNYSKPQQNSHKYHSHHHPNPTNQKDMTAPFENIQSIQAKLYHQPPAPFHMQHFPPTSPYNPQRQPYQSAQASQHGTINNPSQKTNRPNPLELLAQKLRTQPMALMPLTSPPPTNTPQANTPLANTGQQDYLIKTRDIMRLQMEQQMLQRMHNQKSVPKMKDGSIHINVKDPRTAKKQEEAEPDLAYFQQNSHQASQIYFQQIFQKEQEKERKSSENEDIEDMVVLLQNSIRQSQKKQSERVKKEQKLTPKKQTSNKSELGFNLIVTSMAADDFDFALPEKSRQMNRSKINISVDSDDKRDSRSKSNSKSQDSNDLKAKNELKNDSPRNLMLAQSSVTINMEQSLPSPQNRSKNPNSARKVQSWSPEKILSNIQEVSQEISRQNTPIDMNGHYQFRSSTGSNKPRRNKDAEQRNIKGSNSNNMSQSNGHSNKTPLSRPPSLKQQEQYLLESSKNDSKVASGIMVSSDSRHIANNQQNSNKFTSSKMIKDDNAQQQMKGMSSIQLSSESRRIKPEQNQARYTEERFEQEDQYDGIRLSGLVQTKMHGTFDDIFGINLVGESRISRESKRKPNQQQQIHHDNPSSLDYSEQLLPLESKLDQPIARSQPQSIFKRYSLGQNSSGYDEDLDAMRKSSVSSIVRKGSAIQKVKNREQVGTLKMSSYGKTQMKNSSYLSNPIAEAEDDEEEEVHQPTHKKNISSFK